MKPSRDIARLIEIMAALRTPGTGCPWDLEQNFATIAPYTHRGSLRGRRRDRPRRPRRPARTNSATCCCRSCSTPAWPRSKARSISATWSQAITDKLIRRHPHVFGDDARPERRRGQGPVGRRSRPRRRRRAQARRGACRRAATARSPAFRSACPRSTRALKLQQKAGKVGFDWNDPQAVLAKIREETDEIEAALDAGDQAAGRGRDRRPAVRGGQSRAPSRCRSGDGAARDQRQIRAPLRRDRGRRWRRAARRRARRRSTRWTRSGTQAKAAEKSSRLGRRDCTLKRNAVRSRLSVAPEPAPRSLASASARTVMPSRPSSRIAFASTSAWRCSQLTPAPSAGSSTRSSTTRRARAAPRSRRAGASSPSPVSAETSTGRSLAGAARRRFSSCARAVGVEPVDLVPDLDRAARRRPDRCRARAAPPRRRAPAPRVSSCDDVAHVQDHVGLDHLLQRRAEGRDQHGRQVGDEADGVGQDRRARHAAASTARKVGSSVANSMSADSTLALRQPVEQRRLAGIGVADQRHDRIRHALAAVAMQLAGALDLLELALRCVRCAPRSCAGRLRSGSRRGRRGSRSRRAGARDGSRSAPAGSSDRSDARARPAARLRACARAGRRFPGSARCGRAPWRSRPSPDCAAAPARARSPSRRCRPRRLFDEAGDLLDLALAEIGRGADRR